MKKMLLAAALMMFLFVITQNSYAQKRVGADTSARKSVKTVYCSKQIINYSGYYFDIYVDGVLKKEIAAYAKIYFTLPDNAQVKFLSKGKTIERSLVSYCSDTRPLYPVGDGEAKQP